MAAIITSATTGSRIGLAVVILLGTGHASSTIAQSLAVAPATREAVTAIRNVSLIPLDRERIELDQTVIVRGDRIVTVGAARDVAIPDGATVIDGAGRFLIPGLVDAHVHLTTDMPWAPARPDFGEAPLYLAHGVTTVVNLRGTPEQLRWRQQVERGELLGPTIYTAGEFVNEPRVSTPDGVRREIAEQVRQGYDLIKFHELDDTTTGLSLAAYLAMNEAARELSIPLVGHAPSRLGLDALVQGRQSLSHSAVLNNFYFVPISAHSGLVFSTLAALLVIVLTLVSRAAVAVIRRWRGAVARPRPGRRFDQLSLLSRLAALASAICLVIVLPGGWLVQSAWMRVVLAGLAALTTGSALILCVLVIRFWRDEVVGIRKRVTVALMSLILLATGLLLTFFWMPIAWRSTDRNIEALGQRLRDAGVSIQSTLVVYETLTTTGIAKLSTDPAVQYLRADTRALWQRQPMRAQAPERFVTFVKRLVGLLHRQGVVIVAGTDAMGIPLVAPGTSFYRELLLLHECGLTPYEALRAATVNPAMFLKKENEFGTIAVGKRADLVLLDRNPLDDLTALESPAGLIVRGRWLARERLRDLLENLRS